MSSDGFDLERLNELQRSPAWRRVLERIDHMITAEGTLCEASPSPLKIRRAQGAVAALRRVREIPAILRGEIEREMKARRERGE